MTDRQHNLSRRNLFTIAAGGASALALGRMFEGVAHAGAPALPAGIKPLSEAQLPQGLIAAPGDLTLDADTQLLADKLLARMKQAVLDAVAKPGQSAKDDKVAAYARKVLGSLRKTRMTRLETKLKQGSEWQATGADPKRGSGYYATELGRLVEKKAKPEKKVKHEKKIKREKPEEEQKPQYTPPLVERIEFQLNSVKCVRETSGWSSDEILLGGSIITPGGVVKKIASWKVGDDFDAGEAVFYDASKCKDLPANTPQQIFDIACPRGDRNDVYRGRKLEATRLDIAIPWPATVGVVLIMGEEDSGGFNQLIQDGYKAIEDEVKKKLNELGVKAGEAIGGDIGAAIGAAIGAVLGAFVDWLVSLFNTRDDFINSKSWMVKLPSPELAAIKALASDHLPAPAGIWASPMKKLTFVGDGGKYETRLHWRVNT